MDLSEVVVYCDGGCYPNPGPIAYAAVVGDVQGEIIVEQAKNGIEGTNNEAEYRGLILGVCLAHVVGARTAHFFLDSQLVASQVGGYFALNAGNLTPLHSRAMGLLMRLDHWTIKSIPRSRNTRADYLCTQLLRPDDKRLRKAPPDALVFSSEGVRRTGWSGVESRRP